jgi:hypothetical protein
MVFKKEISSINRENVQKGKVELKVYGGDAALWSSFKAGFAI